MKTRWLILSFLLIATIGLHSVQANTAKPQLKVTVLLASNEGSDFELDNDAYRDQLIQLFSYSHYRQLSEKWVPLEKSQRVKVELPENYSLSLTLQQDEGTRIMVQAVIQQDRVIYVDSTLSILRDGVAFLGGPSLEKAVLIIMLENSF